MHTELQRAQEFQTAVESYQEIGKLWNKIECSAQNKGLNPGDGNFGHHEAVTWSNRDAKFQHSRYEPGDERSIARRMSSRARRGSVDPRFMDDHD